MVKFILILALICPVIVNAQVSQSGLIAYYPLNGNTLDFSGNKNDGIQFGGVIDTTDRFGNIKRAKYFNGLDGFISVAHSASIASPDSQITMSAWINMADLTRWQPILVKNSNGSGRINTQYDFFVDNYTPTNGNIAWCPAPQPGPTNCYGAGVINYKPNTWYFLAISMKNDSSSYYLNGDLVIKTVFRKTNLTAINNYPLEIGRNWNAATPVFFTGSMDDLRIYNRGLNDAEMKNLYIQSDLSISGIVHEGLDFLKQGKVLAYNLTQNTIFTTYTDTSGSFLFPSLTDGDYILKGVANLDSNYYDTFYPNRRDSTYAVKLILGESISEIDLYMCSAHTETLPNETLYNSFNVYPNPSSSLVNVVSLNQDVTINKIQIMNFMNSSLEEYVFAQGVNEYEISLENSNPGIYILKVESSSGVYLKKIIKN